MLYPPVVCAVACIVALQAVSKARERNQKIQETVREAVHKKELAGG